MKEKTLLNYEKEIEKEFIIYSLLDYIFGTKSNYVSLLGKFKGGMNFGMNFGDEFSENSQYSQNVAKKIIHLLLSKHFEYPWSELMYPPGFPKSFTEREKRLNLDGPKKSRLEHKL